MDPWVPMPTTPYTTQPTMEQAGFNPIVNGYDVSATGGGNPFPIPVGSPAGAGANPLSALAGVRASATPEAQRVGTPNPGFAPAPRTPTPVRGDQFMQLVQMLGNGGAAAGPQAPNLLRLGQALGGR